MILVVYLLIAYLLGAFPSSVVLGRLVGRIDVREHGSGNAGATNAWRVLGWKTGVAVLVLDVAKGVLAAVAVPMIPMGSVPVDGPTLAVLCGLTAVLGHVFPVYLRFRGGKGVATAAGMLVGVAPIPVGCALGVFAVLLVLFGRVSLGSIIAAWAIPLSAFLLNEFTSYKSPIALIAVTALLAAFITFTHRSNILRLIRGEEKSFPRLQVWRRLFRR